MSQHPAYTHLFKDENEIKLDKVPPMITAGIYLIKEGIDENNN